MLMQTQKMAKMQSRMAIVVIRSYPPNEIDFENVIFIYQHACKCLIHLQYLPTRYHKIVCDIFKADYHLLLFR